MKCRQGERKKSRSSGACLPLSQSNSTAHHRADIESRSIQRSIVMKKILAAFIFVLAIHSVHAADNRKVVSLFDG
jgi:hypothetical protein